MLLNKICGNCINFNTKNNKCKADLPIYITNIDNTTSIDTVADNCKFFTWDITKLKQCDTCKGQGIIIEEYCSTCNGNGGMWDDIVDQWYRCFTCPDCEQCSGNGYFNNE